MTFDVGLHTLLRIESVVANRALVDFLSVMGHLMEFQHMIITERFAANLTGVGFLSGVCSGVHLQLFTASKPFLAYCTDVGLLPSVRSHMDHQLSRLYECLGTHGAFMRAFSGVNSHVSVQLSGVFECPRANLTLVGPFFRVDSPVNAQVFLNAETFITEFAAEGFLSSVRTIVASQTGGDCKCLGTNVTTVGILCLFSMGSLMGLKSRLGGVHFIADLAMEIVLFDLAWEFGNGKIGTAH